MVWDPELGQYTSYRYTKNGWTKGGILTTDVIFPTQSVFLMAAKQAISVTCAGRVVSEEETRIPLSKGINFVANPYATDYPIKEIKGTLTAGALRADQLQRWDSEMSQYVVYRYTNDGWKKTGESDVTTDILSAGEGFVISKPVSDGELVFPSPLK